MKGSQFCKRFPAVLLFLALSLAAFAGAPPKALADETYATFNTPRFILFIKSTQSGGKGELDASEVANTALEMLDGMYEEYSRVFRAEPTKKVVLRFLSPAEFRRETGAPAWTSAMYFRDEISIPFSPTRGLRRDELQRALRHEYVHAIIAELSDYRVPAWLDEGVAQILEGRPNPLLGPALREWTKSNAALPLDWLENGFTTLDPAIVPAAYAQSLFAARKIIRSTGFPSITKYLSLLSEGKDERYAFMQAFGINRDAFENQLTAEMRRWAKSGQEHP